MTPKELRKAAEKLVTWAESDPSDMFYDAITDREAVAMARAYLAEHPEDDDEPVTWDFVKELMLGIGAIHRQKQREYDDEVLELGLPNGYMFFACENSEAYEGCYFYYGLDYLKSHGLPDQGTRGQLRRLLEGLGITAPATAPAEADNPRPDK